MALLLPTRNWGEIMGDRWWVGMWPKGHLFIASLAVISYLDRAIGFTSTPSLLSKILSSIYYVSHHSSSLVYSMTFNRTEHFG